MRAYSIYTITDDSGLVIYVGCTSGSLKERLWAHKNEAKKFALGIKVYNKEKAMSIIENDFNVVINPVESILVYDWKYVQRREEWWIRYFESQGMPIKNKLRICEY